VVNILFQNLAIILFVRQTGLLQARVKQDIASLRECAEELVDLIERRLIITITIIVKGSRIELDLGHRSLVILLNMRLQRRKRQLKRREERMRLQLPKFKLL